jgi:murein DD-endopeptidase MepM/ murein hydrolase activator NlpD
MPSPFKLCSPLKGVRIQELRAILSDGYHPPPPGHDGRHMGVDFAFYTNAAGKQIEGFEANAILPGRAASVIFDRPPFGNAVILETRYEDVGAQEAEWLHITKQQSLYHLYAHLGNAPAVDPNNLVDCGQFLGRVGDSGASGNPHLHLETRYGPPGASFPVLAYDISASPQIGVTEEEKTNYVAWETSGTYQHFDPMDLFSTYITLVNPDL